MTGAVDAIADTLTEGTPRYKIRRLVVTADYG
jgi:hypothetical protein